MLTRSELRELIVDALTEREPAQPAPALLTATELCEQLRCSRATLHRLQLQGLPRLMLLDSPRYSTADVLAWLERRSAAGSATEAAE